MRVRAGSKYVYYPAYWDVLDPPIGGIQPGEVCRVVNLPGCPRANTMGHCHVETQSEDGSWKFAGLVCTASLTPLKDFK